MLIFVNVCGHEKSCSCSFQIIWTDNPLNKCDTSGGKLQQLIISQQSVWTPFIFYESQSVQDSCISSKPWGAPLLQLWFKVPWRMEAADGWLICGLGERLLTEKMTECCWWCPTEGLLMAGWMLKGLLGIKEQTITCYQWSCLPVECSIQLL